MHVCNVRCIIMTCGVVLCKKLYLNMTFCMHTTSRPSGARCRGGSPAFFEFEVDEVV